jgi:hypothetical protein
MMMRMLVPSTFSVASHSVSAKDSIVGSAHMSGMITLLLSRMNSVLIF